jgi:hypothetical protein
LSLGNAIGRTLSLVTFQRAPSHRTIVENWPTAHTFAVSLAHTPFSVRVVLVPAGGASMFHRAPFHRARKKFAPTTNALDVVGIATSRSCGL